MAGIARWSITAVFAPALTLIIGCLLAVKMGIKTIENQEILMSSLFDQPTPVEDIDTVRQTYRGEPVADDQR
jgi:hypothetical protein